MKYIVKYRRWRILMFMDCSSRWRKSKYRDLMNNKVHIITYANLTFNPWSMFGFTSRHSPIFLCRPTAFFRLAGAVGRQRVLHTENSGFAHATLPWHISTFRGYPKPLYKSLHQSFFYSFITILSSESGVTLHYSTILP